MFKPHSSKDGTFHLGSPLETKGFTPTAIFFYFLPQIFQEYNLRIARSTQVCRSRGPARGRVQQKILCLMLKDCSQ